MSHGASLQIGLNKPKDIELSLLEGQLLLSDLLQWMQLLLPPTLINYYHIYIYINNYDFDLYYRPRSKLNMLIKSPYPTSYFMVILIVALLTYFKDV